MLRRIPAGSTMVAGALGVTPRAVQYWRAGTHTPTVKHWHQMGRLLTLLLMTGANVETGVRIIDLGRQQDAAD
jgi:hypothetical protein